MCSDSPSYSSMICASSEVPSVAVTSAWVSPRVKSAEPWVRGSSAHLAGDRADLVEARGRRAGWPVEDRLARQDLDEVVRGARGLIAARLLGLGNERDRGLLDGLDLA